MINMTYIVYPNENNLIECYKIDSNVGGDFYLQHHAGSILVDNLPDEDYQDCWEISGNEVVVGSKAVERKQGEIKELINEEVQSKLYDNIIVNGNEFDVSEKILTNLLVAQAPVDWILVDNTTVTLLAQDLSDVIAAISTRTTDLVKDGRRKKDLVLAMTTLEELEAVDIEAL